MESSQVLASVTAIHEDARRRGLFFQTCSDAELHGRTVTLHGRPMLSFSSCSYLGLELHPAVRAGAHDAIDRYGTQFSCSRGYLSAPIYTELEGTLEALFGASVLVTPSTTMAHLAALPVLATEKDAVVLDHQAHHSIHMGANQARAGGAVVEMVRHDRLGEACDVVRRLAQKAKTVWFCSDGVFSMYGDLAPIGVLQAILDVAPNVRLYIDDAHGMSWAGTHGCGSFLSRFPMSERVVLATSFAKGFGAGGGCLVFSNPAERDQVRLSGGPLVFSGPMQPPMMGAALASAKIHLSNEITGLQETLRARVLQANQLLCSSGIPPIAVNESPIIFLLCGLPRVAFRVAEKLTKDGIYVNCSVFPTVPMKRAGIRFTVTSAHSADEIGHAVSRLAEHIPSSLEEEGLSQAELSMMFAGAVPEESRTSTGSTERRNRRQVPGHRLVLHRHASIRELDKDEWNGVLAASAHCSWDALAMQEQVFGPDAERPEHRWSFQYLLVRDLSGKVVAATFLTVLLQKDDMLSREEVSREVEVRRKSDPYFLTSKVVMVGSCLSEGNHLYADRSGPWTDAVRLILSAANRVVEEEAAGVLIVRDLPGNDPEMDQFMLVEGLARVPMFDTHLLDIDGKDEAAWFEGLPRRKRKALRPIVDAADQFSVSFHGHGLAPMSDVEAKQIFSLYRQLASRKLRLNVFAFPEDLLVGILGSPAWEVGVLRIRPEAGGPPEPVAFWAAHKYAGEYAPLFCGLDDAWLLKYETYRAMFLQMTRRARALGMSHLHLGMDAEMEKRRFGGEPFETCIYLQIKDHHAGAMLREIAAEVAFAADGSAAK